MSATTPSPHHPRFAIEEIVVTGSRIARPDLVSSSPIDGRRAGTEAVGIVNTENLLNTLAQAVPGVTSTLNNGSGGAATVNLRGLGANRTLVLVDGKRPTPTSQTGTVDLSYPGQGSCTRGNRH